MLAILDAWFVARKCVKTPFYIYIYQNFKFLLAWLISMMAMTTSMVQIALPQYIYIVTDGTEIC